MRTFEALGGESEAPIVAGRMSRPEFGASRPLIWEDPWAIC